MPFVTIVVPSHNQPDLLQACLDSLLAQHHADWECVVVDDGSADRTPEVAAAFVAADPRFRLIRQTNAGVSVARNVGLRAARGEWVAFLDADDFYFPEALAAFAARTRVTVPGTGAPRVLCGNLITSFLEPPPPARVLGDVHDLFFRTMHFTARGRSPQLQNSLFHRSLLERTGGFDPELRTSEDRDFLIRAAAVCPVLLFPDLVAFYRTHHGTGKSDRYLASGQKTAAHRRIFERLPAFVEQARDAGPVEAAAFSRLRRAYLQLLEAVDRTREGDLEAACRHLGEMDEQFTQDDERRAFLARLAFFFRHPSAQPRLAAHSCARQLAALRGALQGSGALARALERQIRKEAARLGPGNVRQTLAFDHDDDRGGGPELPGVPAAPAAPGRFRVGVRGRWPLPDQQVAVLGHAGTAVTVDPDIADALLACGPFRTIEQHVQILVGRGVLPGSRQAALRSVLEGLQRRGGLQPSPAVGRSPADRGPVDGGAPDEIPRLVLTATATAAGALATLDSYLDRLAGHHRSLQVLVVDDLALASESSALRDGLHRRRQTSGLAIRQASRRDRAHYVRRLLREARGSAAPDHASLGAWMNTVVLDSGAAPFVTAAEGTRCRTAHLDQPWELLLFTGHPSPQRTIAFDGPLALNSELAPGGPDVLAVHAKHLGRPCRVFAAEYPWVDLSGDPGVGAAAHEGHVAVTMASLYGRVGGDPRHVLLERESLDPCLFADPDRYRRMMAGCNVWRGVQETTVSRTPFLHTLATGFWNPAGVLPPFPPARGGGEKLFGCVLALVDPRAHVAHLPVGIEYNRPGSPQEDDAAAVAALAAVDLDSLHLAALLSYQPPRRPPAPHDALTDLGAHLLALAALDGERLMAVLWPTLMGWMSSEIQALDRVWSLYEGQPPHWAATAKTYGAAVRASLAAGPPPALIGDTQAALRDHGRLLQAWPALIAAADRLRERGLGLASPPHAASVPTYLEDDVGWIRVNRAGAPRSKAGRALLGRLDGVRPSERHPRVLIDPDDLALWRLELARAPDDWQALHELATCLAAGDATSPPPNLPAGGALTMAVAHVVSGDRCLLDGALSAIQRALALRGWTATIAGIPAIDERAATWSSELALAADLLWDWLPAKLRARLLHHLEARAVGVFPGLRRAGRQPWARHRCREQVVVHSHLGLATMAVYEVLDDWRHGLRPALEGVLDFLENDGGRPFREGLASWQDAIGELVWFGLALRTFTRGEVDLFTHPALEAAHDYAWRLQGPVGQLGGAPGSQVATAGWLTAVLAREYGRAALPPTGPPGADQVLRSALCPQLGRRPAGSAGRVPQPGWFLPDLNLVSLQAEPGPGALRVVLRAGGIDGTSGGDVGSLAIQQGTDVLLTCAGCPVTVNGERPEPGTGVARFVAADLQGSLPWAVADLTATYRGSLHRLRRFVIAVAVGTIVVIDDLVAAAPSHLRWQLAHAGEVQMQSTRFLVQVGAIAAQLSFPLLDRRARYRLTEEDWLTFQPDRPVASAHLLSVSPLRPTRHWVVAAVIQVGASTEPTEVVQELHLQANGCLRFAVHQAGEPRWVVVDLPGQQVRVDETTPLR